MVAGVGVALLLVLAAAAGSAPPRACTEGEACVVLGACPSLAELVRANATAEERGRLQSTLCGYHQGPAPKTPRVCCPLLPAAHECGVIFDQDKGPIRGNGTYVMEIPWIARLGYQGRSGIEYQCGGTLISSRYVLTAARCTSRPPVTVRLGERDLNSDPDCQLLSPEDYVCAPPLVDVAVEEVVVHPGAPGDDMALLRLDRHVAFSMGLRPICLPVHLASDQPQDTRALWAEMAGWGSIGGATGEQSDVLFRLRMRIANHSYCADKYKEHPGRIDDSRQLCAGLRAGLGPGPATDACRGDTGGPLTQDRAVAGAGPGVRSVLLGVVSFGPKVCAEGGTPAVFSRVSHYMSWIMGQLRP